SPCANVGCAANARATLSPLTGAAMTLQGLMPKRDCSACAADSPGPLASMSTVWAWKRSAVYSIHSSKPQYFWVRRRKASTVSFGSFMMMGPWNGSPLRQAAHEDDLGDLALIALETSPHRACGRVVFLFLSKRSIDADDDVIAGRKLVVGVFPNLPPVTLEDAAFVRHR